MLSNPVETGIENPNKTAQMLATILGIFTKNLLVILSAMFVLFTVRE
jgi:branched-subunit amino acid transport protein